jgi:uncharacterized phage protein (TIGR01671 family)
MMDNDQDRFKMRAWDQDLKEMVYSQDADYSTAGESPIHKSYMDLQWFFGNIAFRKNVVLMQCSGLGERNGPLIYQGDIIEITNDNENDHGFYLEVGSRYVVEWVDDGFALVNPQYPFDNGKHACIACATEHKGLMGENHEIDIGFYSKVLGNRHEHPELLGKQK